MDAATRLAILTRVTEQYLDMMAKEGWWHRGEYVHTRPTPWFINCGDCENWASEASMALAGKSHITTQENISPTDVHEGVGEIVWIEEMEWPRWDGLFAHAVLLYEGRYYDSETLEGADDISGLTMVKAYLQSEKRRKKSRKRVRHAEASQNAQEWSGPRP
jgi:hypothetical protein